MKRVKILYSLLILILISSIGFSQKNRDVFNIKVEGLGCPFCAYGLEKKLKEIKSIKKIKIDMETGVTSFEVSERNKVSLEDVASKVEKAGYTPVALKVTRYSGLVEEIKDKTKAKNKLAKLEKLQFHVKGNCEMCKARIEKAAMSMKGVDDAIWNVDTKQLSLYYDKKLASPEKIAKAIVDVGHDTDSMNSKDSVYDSLPVCCLYRNR